MKIIKKLYNWLTRKKMAKKVYSIEKILADLNKNVSGTQWLAVEGVFSINKSTIDKDTKKVMPEGESLVLKTFIKPDTGEVRIFVAKILEDESETIDLP